MPNTRYEPGQGLWYLGVSTLQGHLTSFSQRPGSLRCSLGQGAGGRFLVWGMCRRPPSSLAYWLNSVAQSEAAPTSGSICSTWRLVRNAGSQTCRPTKSKTRHETLHLCFDQVTVIPAKGRHYRVKTASWEPPNHSASWGIVLTSISGIPSLRHRPPALLPREDHLPILRLSGGSYGAGPSKLRFVDRG